MSRMIATGPDRFTLPFAALGFEAVRSEPSDFLDVLRGVLEDASTGLVVCGESFVAQADVAAFKELCAGATAAVLVAPDGPESQGLGYELIRRSVEQAAGVDLLGSIDTDNTDLPAGAAADGGPTDT